MRYDFAAIDRKWQQRWREARAFEAKDETDRPKFYGLVEFPYPSGSGMHVGHIKAYAGLEAICRKRRMQGYNVLFPIGFDAFGLPTENSAIKTGIHPRELTDRNIRRFTEQLQRVGLSFDWSRTIDTTDERYYKWTQFIFLKMFEHGLVFRDRANVNYCPHCGVVLSNEDSQGGRCDVCHSEIVQRSKDVWYLRITEYADKLLEGLDEVDYQPGVRMQQVNWIGKSRGAFVNFPLSGGDETIRIYTTRPDTMFGATFMVLAPEHPILERLTDRIANMDEARTYREACARKTEFERTQLVREKTGVRLKGVSAVNPADGREIPIFLADYVMMGYGTGAIMAVPAHDERDYEFAVKFGAEILPVIKGGDVSKGAYTGEGEMINSGFLNGCADRSEAVARMIAYLERTGQGEAGVQYKMKDWAFNRQRYWGEPIPIVYCERCGMVPVPYDQLPLRLPPVSAFQPGTDGESPLARIDSFVHCACPKCGGPARRETDTMPQWAGSSWYFLRYVDPCNDACLADPDKLRYWLPVDWYNGGMEHVTRHMIYSRFWHRFLYDIGLVPTKEPYAKRTTQGLILGADGEKMSKSRGNVVDPNDVMDEVGADVLRVYILFMGDYGASGPWSDSSMRGCKRFLERVADLPQMVGEGAHAGLETAFHKTVRKVSSDIEEMKFNTAIAALMGLLNAISDAGSLSREQLSVFTRLLCPFAPHLCEEIWESAGGEGFCSLAPWPEYDEAKTVDETVEMAVQVNGRVRGKITLPPDADREAVLAAARADSRICAFLEGRTVVREIVVPNRIVNIVVR